MKIGVISRHHSPWSVAEMLEKPSWPSTITGGVNHSKASLPMLAGLLPNPSSSATAQLITTSAMVTGRPPAGRSIPTTTQIDDVLAILLFLGGAGALKRRAWRAASSYARIGRIFQELFQRALRLFAMIFVEDPDGARLAGPSVDAAPNSQRQQVVGQALCITGLRHGPDLPHHATCCELDHAPWSAGPNKPSAQASPRLPRRRTVSKGWWQVGEIGYACNGFATHGESDGKR